MDQQKRKLTRKEKDALSRQNAAVQPSSKKKSQSDKTTLFAGLVAAALGFMLYVNTISYDYTLDDMAAINSNIYVQKGFAGIGDILHTAYWSGYRAGNNTLFRPISLVMFAVEWQFFPNNPAAGHFMNVLLYALTGFLLFRLLNRLFSGQVAVSLLATLLFMAHPVHTEVVANIKSRDEILCLLFCIASLSWFMDYLDFKKTRPLIYSAGSFFLALLSKENAITWLAVFPLAAVVFRDFSWKKAVAAMLPYGAVALLYLFILVTIQHGTLISKSADLTNNVLAGAPGLMTRYATAIFVLGKYLMLLILPVHLSMDYSFGEIQLMSPGDYRVLLSLATLVILLGAGIGLMRKRNAAGFAIIYFLITISIVSNFIFVIGTVMADRLLYMPSLGMAVALSYLLVKLTQGETLSKQTNGLMEVIKGHRLSFVIGGAVLLGYSVRTVARNPVWTNNQTLFASGIEDAPGSAYVHYLYSNELIKRAKPDSPADSLSNNALYDAAITGYEKAIAIKPHEATFYNELAATYRKKKMTEEALKYYGLTLKYNPRLPQAYNGMGVIYFEQKKYREALENFSQSVKLNGVDPVSLRNMGGCLLILGDNNNAIAAFQKSLKYNPSDPQVLQYMGYAYENLGDSATAGTYFEKARLITPAPAR